MKPALLPSLLVLSACGSGASGQWRQETDDRGEKRAGVECATDGASGYRIGCTIERTGAVLTIRSPTGSFRRLYVRGGRIEAADGAEPARLVGEDGRKIDVAIDGDRYRIPRGVLR